MSNSLRFDIEHLKSAIDALLVNYPELQDDETLRADMFAGSTSIDEVLSKLVDQVVKAENFIAALEARISTNKARADRFQRKADAARSLINTVLDRANLKQRVLDEATLSVSYRKGTPFVLNDEAVPDACCKIERKASLTKIKEWIEAHDGQLPSGTSMSNGKQVLTIRSK
jgi:hypothetical protein